jgi:hypothetical protein
MSLFLVLLVHFLILQISNSTNKTSYTLKYTVFNATLSFYFLFILQIKIYKTVQKYVGFEVLAAVTMRNAVSELQHCVGWRKHHDLVQHVTSVFRVEGKAK